MNALEKHLQAHKLDPVLTMNDLQNAGVVSNNTVYPEDVADADCERAIKWLAQNKEWF